MLFRAAVELQQQLRTAIGMLLEALELEAGEAAVEAFKTDPLSLGVGHGADLDAELKLMYQVSNASWTPFYEARLTSGTDAKEPGLDLTRRASITQQSGEAWQDVALTLSTAAAADTWIHVRVDGAATL